MIKLYTYFRSSASYRVRIALNLKGLPFESIPVHLLRAGGLQHTPDYARINPAQLVPTLVDGELTLGQSLAIIEYLEEMYPEPALLPTDAAGRAEVAGLKDSVFRLELLDGVHCGFAVSVVLVWGKWNTFSLQYSV